MSSSHKKLSFDLIVLGAGPAGAASAMMAAKSGLSVALVDKRTFPRDKLCGGGVTGRALNHVSRIFDRHSLGIPAVTKTDFSFRAFGEDLGADQNAPPISLIMRKDFDHALVTLALDAGAIDFTGQSGVLDAAENSVTIGGLVLSSPVIIAADGVNSPAARHMFGTPFERDQIGFALEVEHPDLCTDQPLQIDFGAAQWGYGWRFPKTRSTTIGVGGVLSKNDDIKTALTDYLAKLGVANAGPVKGQFLPFGQFRKVPGKGTVLLAGDAAGLVDPITGEGIGHALHSGELAALAAIRALREGNPTLALRYYRQSLAPVHAGLRCAGVLRHVIFREALRPAFVSSFRNSRTLRRDYLNLLAGQLDYGELMVKTAARMPRFAARVLAGKLRRTTT